MTEDEEPHKSQESKADNARPIDELNDPLKRFIAGRGLAPSGGPIW